MAFHRRRQPPYALANLLRSGVRKVQAHVAGAFVAIAGVEGIARHERYILLDCRFEKGLDVDSCGQSYPEEYAALRMSPSHFRREELFQSLKHYVAPFAINLTNQLHVFVEESIARDFVGHELSESRSVQVGTLLQLRQLTDDLRRSDDPPQTEPGSQRL